MVIERIQLDKDIGGVRKIYRTDDSKELDAAFHLQGRSLNKAGTAALMAEILDIGLPSTESEITVPYFIELAGRIGVFAGVADEDIPIMLEFVFNSGNIPKNIHPHVQRGV